MYAPNLQNLQGLGPNSIFVNNQFSQQGLYSARSVTSNDVQSPRQMLISEFYRNPVSSLQSTVFSSLSTSVPGSTSALHVLPPLLHLVSLISNEIRVAP